MGQRLSRRVAAAEVESGGGGVRGGWGSTLESGDGEVGGAAVAEGGSCLQLGGETNGTL